MNKKFYSLILFAILTEGIVTYADQFFIGGSFCPKMLMSIILGVVVAISYDLDLPEYLDMQAHVPYIGCILTGILISRGSNYLYDLISKLSSIN